MNRRMIAGAVAACALLTPALGSADDATLSFEPPIKVNASGLGFEPSIDVDSTGRLYVTAHKGSLTNEGTRLSSFLWSSTDAGRTWSEMTSPGNVHDKLYSFEGDIAVDARDRMYFVDTYGADNWISRWSPDGAWMSTGVAVTPSIFDDRPWIAAHGDGIVYLLTMDVATNSPPADLLTASNATTWAIAPVLYGSTDGGLTWTTLRAFPDAGACNVAASPLDDVSLAVVCLPVGTGGELLVSRSPDRGATWTDDTGIYTFRGTALVMPSLAYDRAGNLYAAVNDIWSERNEIKVASRIDGTWRVRDVTPFTGSFREMWISAADPGEVGIGFYATPDFPVRFEPFVVAGPSPGSEWFVYGGVTANATAADPSWSIAQVDPVRTITGFSAPPDFLQVVIGPDGTLYVAYSREAATDVAHAPPPNFDHDIYVARQASGPNL